MSGDWSEQGGTQRGQYGTPAQRGIDNVFHEISKKLSYRCPTSRIQISSKFPASMTRHTARRKGKIMRSNTFEDDCEVGVVYHIACGLTSVSDAIQDRHSWRTWFLEGRFQGCFPPYASMEALVKMGRACLPSSRQPAF